VQFPGGFWVQTPPVSVIDFDKHDAVVIACMVDGDKSVKHVVEHLFRISLQRIAVPAADGRVVGDDVGDVGPQARKLGGLRMHLADRRLPKFDLAAVTRLAAKDAPGLVLVTTQIRGS
jgi:hypothetical protein